MRRNDVKIGMLVVATNRPKTQVGIDPQVYVVEAKDGFRVQIMYLVSGMRAATVVDCSTLTLASPAQLEAGGWMPDAQ